MAGRRLLAQTRPWRYGEQGGTLIGLAMGLVVGVLISFGVVWYLNKTPLPFQDRVAKSEPNKEGKAAGNGTVALPGKPGDKPAERKFEFYDILEGKKDATPVASAPKKPAPTGDPVAASVPATAPVPTPASSGVLYLQAGAFQKTADAENLKARLAMLGLEAGILDVEVPDKGLMHRVRVGPYANAEEANRVRGQLSQNGITAAVVRVKD